MKTKQIGSIAIVAAIIAALVSATGASATNSWTPSRFSCAVGKNAVLKFTVVNSSVIIGYGRTIFDAAQGSSYQILSTGVRSISTGLSAGYWQKWTDNGPGTITSSNYSCVNFLFAPAPQ